MSTFEATVVTASTMIMAALAVLACMSCAFEIAWSVERFDGGYTAVRITPVHGREFYLCADEINGEMKNCVSDQQVVEFAREYWTRRGEATTRKK